MVVRKKQGFPLSIHLDHHVGEQKATLTRSFWYVDKDGVTYTAHAGLLTDGGSIPRFFYRLIGPPYASPYLAAYIVHDAICANSEHLARDGDLKDAQMLRKEADELFYEMLRYLGCPLIKAKAMYRGVRIGSVSLRFAK